MLLPVHHIAYPFFYYYVGALGVMPVALLIGPTPQAIAVGWRLVSIVSFITTNALLFYVARRYFQLKWMGLIAMVFYSLNYSVLFAVLSLRPPTFETLVNFLVLILLFELVKEHRFKFLVLTAIAAGCGFSTKYHALFLIPTIFGVIMYSTFKDNTIDENVFRIALKRSLVISLILTGLAIAFYLIVGSMASDPQGWMARFPDNILATRVLGDFIIQHIYRYAKLLLYASVLFSVVEIASFFFFSRKGSFSSSLQSNLLSRTSVGMYRFIIFLFFFGLTILVTNPYGIVFPQRTLDVFFRIYEIMFSAKDWNTDGLGKQSDWFLYLYSKILLGAIGTCLLVYSLIFFLVKGWKDPHMKKGRLVGLVLLSHLGIYFGYLLISVKLKKHHYIVPVMPDIALLAAFGLAVTFSLISRPLLKSIAVGLVALLLIGNILERKKLFIWTYNFYTKKDSEQIVQLADWIDRTYKDKVFVSDTLLITYLLKMEGHRGRYRNFEPDMRQLVSSKTPDLVLLFLKENQLLVDELKNQYRVIRSEPYKGVLTDEFDFITILERIASPKSPGI